MGLTLLLLPTLLRPSSGCGAAAERPDVPAPAADVGLAAADVPGWTPDATVRVCVRGERRCRDAGTPEVCADDGRAWLTQAPCPADESCDPRVGACVGQCRPGDGACLSQTTGLTCAPTGRFVEVVCRAPLVCLADGACGSCRPGETRCVDARTVERCAPEGGAYTVREACPGGARCVEGGGGCRACGECAGEGAWLACPADGEPHAAPCPAGTFHCLPGAGCVACLPHSWRCLDAATGAVCRVDGTGWEPSGACPPGTLCDPTDRGCRACAEGDALCLDRGTRAVCAADRAETRSCERPTYCAGGVCVAGACRADVLLLVDRSGSMVGPKWAEVEATVTALVARHPDAVFGLLAFPGDVTPPMVPSTPADLARWFAFNAPGGNTPLEPILNVIAGRADLLWGDRLFFRRYLVVLSDGGGTECAPTPFPVPPPPTGDCLVDGVAAASRHLLETHGVHTFAIAFGVEPGGEGAAQLVAIGRNGGTSLDGYVAAGDAAELASALDVVLSDPKICE